MHILEEHLHRSFALRLEEGREHCGCHWYMRSIPQMALLKAKTVSTGSFSPDFNAYEVCHIVVEAGLVVLRYIRHIVVGEAANS